MLPAILNVTFDLAGRALRELPGAAVNVAEFAFDTGVDVAEWTIHAGEDVLAAAVDVAEDGFQRVGDLFDGGGESSSTEVIAPLFTPEIAYWEDDIVRWSEQYQLDPNLMATVMQIESCGHPTVASHAGAQGLFQVMPFHFATGEDQLDPDTNAMRGAGVLQDCLRRSNGDPGLAMACYNGGPSVIGRDMSTWLDEPRRYYYWGTGIYADAQSDSSTSGRLNEWLNAGGARLCNMASAEIESR